ncbi:MAG: protein kinase, partial [Firmicutes bacterium]|nr:protein kinase [Bacillota bacterium]
MGTKVLAGRYELFERIGEGGMSVVYKAKDKLLNRFVAIKILKPEFIHDTKFIDSFRRESQAAASLSHPNIVNIYDVGREGNIHYIVMELIEGRTLSEYIKRKGAMSYTKVITLAKQIAAALAFAHKNHIIHRDVKPHNVMITPNGTAKITDFGIAKAVNSATIVDNTEGIIGSVHYFSPEQARGGYVDEKSDIYSLGIVMYEMLTGRVPFDGDNPVNIALMHINGEMVPPSKLVPGVPPALEHIILKCTDKYPVNRYASADELIEALNNLEFVGSMVGDSVLMGKNGRPIAMTDYRDGTEDEDQDQDYDEPRRKKKSSGSRKKKK